MRCFPLRWLSSGLLLLYAGVISAQAACSPGMIPYGTGQGQAFCGPDDSQRQSPPRPPAPQWVDRFGAIATDGPGGSFGASTDMPSRASADDAALLDCRSKKGSATCEIEISYWDQCAAMVAGHSGYNTKAGVTVDLAIETAMKVCNDADTHCHVYYTACSLPQQIR
jgi:hypothetical protein